MICGLGIDLVEVVRIEKTVKKWGDRFVKRIYSENERRYCENKSNPYQHYAVRFAAKEAFLKCLGLGLGSGIGFNQMEIILDAEGKPLLRLYSKAQDALKRIDAQNVNVHVSLTHTSDYASAVVILER